MSMSLSFFYNDLLFEIYHYIPKFDTQLLNKASKRMRTIDGRIERYVYYQNNIYEELYEACLTGNIHIAKFIININSSFIMNDKYHQQDWNYFLQCACQSSNMNIIKLIIKKGATTWNYGLYGGCYSGNIKIINLMIKKGANDWNVGLLFACSGGHIKIVKLMIKKGANTFDDAFYSACRGNNKKIMKLMIKKGAIMTKCNWCKKSIQDHLLKK